MSSFSRSKKKFCQINFLVSISFQRIVSLRFFAESVFPGNLQNEQNANYNDEYVD